MNQNKNLSSSIGYPTLMWAVTLALIICGASAGKVFAAAADSLDQLYEKAKKEGKITLYAPLSPSAMSVIPPAFMKRFPGVTVDHIDATSDKLIARVLAEQKGGRVIADVISGALTYLPQILDLKIVEHVVIPEAAAYPAQLKGDLWVATDTQYYIAGWNTNLVKKGEEPRSYEELANPKWKDSIMGEPRDYQMLVGFAKRKYNNDEKAIDLFKKIAANQVEFHRGHSSNIKKYRGTGLGLAIVKKFANLLGGEVAVESELGKGSVFTVTLPFENSFSETSGPTLARFAGEGRGEGTT